MCILQLIAGKQGIFRDQVDPSAGEDPCIPVFRRNNIHAVDGREVFHIVDFFVFVDPAHICPGDDPDHIPGRALADLHDRIGGKAVLHRQVFQDLSVPEHEDPVPVCPQIGGLFILQNAKHPAGQLRRIVQHTAYLPSVYKISPAVRSCQDRSVPAFRDAPEIITPDFFRKSVIIGLPVLVFIQT